MLRTLCVPALLMVAVPALAQTTQPTPPADPLPHGAPPSATAPPEKVAPSDRNLSNTLSRQKGTITPPNVDPGMTVAPPRNSSTSTPVIPPPGSTGGNRSVVPK